MVAGRFDLPMRPDLQDEHSAICRRFALLTGDELQRLCGVGMTIGAHTMSHPILSQVSVEQAHAEIAESRQRIESAIGKRVWAFAYPFGDPQSVTGEVLDMPKKAGYELAFLNHGGGLGAELPPYAMPRLHVSTEMQIAELDAHLSGFYRRLRGGAGYRLRAAGAADKKLS
jgi:peptidoglycan/xylan/chitin deacetylase (PgdA/CDA1 family)